MTFSEAELAVIGLGLVMFLWGIDKILDFANLPLQQITSRAWTKFGLGIVYFVVGLIVIVTGIIIG